MIGLGFLAAAQIAGGADASALWRNGVQKLLDVNCVKCHGPMQQKGGLELDTADAALKGGDDGPVIVAGKPEASQIIKNLAADAEQHMPPKKQLTDAERGMVREWIAALTASSAKSTPRPVRHFDSVTQAIDTLIAEGWKQRGVTPAAAVDERTWCRRVYLDLAGRICTPEELKDYLQSSQPLKRAALVNKLLESNDYPVHMRELWDVFLMGRPKRERTEESRRKNGWWAFLENGFRTNRPWDETVRAIIVARADQPEDKGASWLIYEHKNDHQAIAEAVAPLVYGTKIGCAQCHDHPLAREIKQAHYWGLVAAFNRSKNVEGGSEVSESAVGGFVNFTNLKKESQPAIVTLLNGPVVKEERPAADAKEDDNDDKYIDPKAKVRVPKFSRREAFADAATHDNPLVARAFVNRAWAVFMGRGIVQPADEMTARNAPSHPELLDWLARDFATNHYDIRRLVRGIVLSRAYALGSGKTPPEAFACAIERPLSAEQLARSWRIASGHSPDDESLRHAAITAFPDVLPRDYTANYQQAQFLANSPFIAAILKPEPGTAVARIAALPSFSGRVREAFLDVYERAPDAKEASEAEQLLKGEKDDPNGAARDLLWALMTSAEFLTRP